MNPPEIPKSTASMVQEQVNLLKESIKEKKTILESQRKYKHTGTKLDWTTMYKKWEKWEDVDEINNSLLEDKKKILNIKSKTKMRMQSSSCGCASKDRYEERRVAQMSTIEILKNMTSFRKKYGNACFDKGYFTQALQWYEKALNYFEYSFSQGEEKLKVHHERLLCLLNAAACFIHLKKFQKCIEYCTDALRMSDGKNMKALFRRAVANRCCGNFESASEDLRAAIQVNLLLPTMDLSHQESFSKEKKLLKTKIQKYSKRRRNFAQRMMEVDKKETI